MPPKPNPQAQRTAAQRTSNRYLTPNPNTKNFHFLSLKHLIFVEKSSAMAKGLKEANEKLDAMNLPEKERKAYDKYLRAAFD